MHSNIVTLIFVPRSLIPASHNSDYRSRGLHSYCTELQKSCNHVSVGQIPTLGEQDSPRLADPLRTDIFWLFATGRCLMGTIWPTKTHNGAIPSNFNTNGFTNAVHVYRTGSQYWVKNGYKRIIRF